MAKKLPNFHTVLLKLTLSMLGTSMFIKRENSVKKRICWDLNLVGHFWKNGDDSKNEVEQFSLECTSSLQKVEITKSRLHFILLAVTVWKFKNFSASRILREINYGKTSALTKCKKFTKSKIQRNKNFHYETLKVWFYEVGL